MAKGDLLADNGGPVAPVTPTTTGYVLTSNGALALPTFQAPGSGPVASAFPLEISSDFAVSAGTGVVVPESFEIDPGVVFEIGAGARVEVTGPVRKVAQQVSSVNGNVQTGSTTIPVDDTIPQITEGDEYFSVTITPKNAASTLRFDVTVFMACATAQRNKCVAVFQDNNANAIGVGGVGQVTAAIVDGISFSFTALAGTTNATRYSVRAGVETSGTNTINGSGGTRRYGGVYMSGIIITEYLP